MSRRFLRSFFDFHDPFFLPSMFHRPTRIHLRQWRPIERQALAPRNQARDPQQVFDNFFNENGIKDESEKDFFKKHYPEKVQEQFDPFKVLELSKDASQEQIKQAYRKLAIKYHPKNNNTPEAQEKFAQLARAYQQAIQSKNQVKFSDLGFNSFFQDFDKQVKQLFETPKQTPKQPQSGKQTQQSQQVSNANKDSFGQLYSQSSQVQNINGKQTKYVVEKKYKKDGKFLSVKRQQTLKDDGNTQIVETINDGKQTKKKTYILDKDTKETKQLE